MGTKIKDLIETTILNLDDLKGSVVAVDGMNMLFQILYNPAQHQQALPDTFYFDSTHRVITHLYGWLQKVSHFYGAQILPLVVFDGKAEPYKRLDSKNVVHDFLYAKKEYETARKRGDIDTAKFYAKSRSFLFLNCVEESMRLLRACGVPVLKAPSEAEAQCAALQQAGVVQYVITNDYDALLFGAEKVLRKLTFSSRIQKEGKWIAIKPVIQLINLSENLQRLGITRDQLIDIAILLGNDYFRDGIPNVGSKTAIKSILAYKSLPPMKKAHPELFKDLPLELYVKIKSLFLKPVATVIDSVNIGAFNPELLRDLLLRDHTLKKEKVEAFIKRIETRYQRTYRKIFKPIKKGQDNDSPEITVFDRGMAIETENSVKGRYPINKYLRRHLDRAKVKKMSTPISTEFISADKISPKKTKR